MTSGRHTRTGIQGLGCSDPIKQCKHHCQICSTQQRIHRTRKKSLALIRVKVSILCNTENNGIHQWWRRAYWDFVIWTLLTPHTQKLHALHQKSKRTYIYIYLHISLYINLYLNPECLSWVKATAAKQLRYPVSQWVNWTRWFCVLQQGFCKSISAAEKTGSYTKYAAKFRKMQ